MWCDDAREQRVTIRGLLPVRDVHECIHSNLPAFKDLHGWPIFYRDPKFSQPNCRPFSRIEAIIMTAEIFRAQLTFFQIFVLYPFKCLFVDPYFSADLFFGDKNIP